jgi:NTP pyrophosphatase (non-canonical NTP hydrolase)
MNTKKLSDMPYDFAVKLVKERIEKFTAEKRINYINDIMEGYCHDCGRELEHQEKKPLTFKRLQEEQKPWVQHNFPGRTFEEPFKGMVEELGELSHALLKQKQAIRGTFEEHENDIKDAIGDLIIFCSDFCEARGLSFQEIVEKTWNEVKIRDWKKFPKNGRIE